MRRAGIEVKIEVNFVMRGTVRPARMAALTPIARETLLADLQITTTFGADSQAA